MKKLIPVAALAKAKTLVTKTDSGGQVMFYLFNSLDGRVVRASASGAVDLGLIPSRVKPMTLILVFTAFLLGAQH